MSEDKVPPQVEVDTNSSNDLSGADLGDGHLELRQHSSAEIESLGKWYDKKFRVFGAGFRFSDSMTQVVMLSFVVFMTPGMYNALSGIGASIKDVKTSDNSVVALYSTFATIGFFGGTICNTIGVRASLIFGGIGYALYSASLLCYYHTENKGFVIFAGAFLGVCASVLWAAQGSIIMSYPAEGQKGRALMVFWVIFNLGAVIGSIIPLANNLENKNSFVNDGTYIAFIILMCLGSVIAFFMLPISKVWKADGTRVMTKAHPNWKKELMDMGRLLIKEPKIYFLFPMFFSSNWFYTYQFNEFNAGRFNLRTRSLNSLLYWFSQMVGAVAIGTVLDMGRYRRSVRAKIGWVIVFLTGMAIWGGGLKFQLGFTREDVTPIKHADGTITPARLAPIDYKEGKYIGPMFLYMFYGVYDAIFQNFILWTLGAMSNNPKKTALYGGFYKGIQSAAAAIAWRLDAMGHLYMAMFGSSWGLVQGSLLIAAPLILFKITDHTELEDDGMENIFDADELRSVKSTVGSNLPNDEKV
ncbi:MFS general substrate transporter [Suhomyces tanzawaensis NRRL Y-17324]|uniref:MFS general substrate transporter n=1 Tax=Suhomyces tanzawaensis NRRL Y-17324 TaxID=984487 RepID=A0A1E4SB80_9ASCO|nr:MFS general substrate transporter [Suhomyces tanzawaensis NRRL Y-17324]ODV76759.1 MFS general substrate transporter [Suhomyces tanzawaensis NRRL Y-17324]